VKYKLIITSAAAALLAGTVLAAGQETPRPQPGAQEQGAKGQQPSQRKEQTEPRGQRGAQNPSDRPSNRTLGQGQREQGQAQGAQREGQSQSPSKQSQTPSKKQTQAPSNRQTPSTTGQGPREQGQREEGRQGQQGQGQRDREPARQRDQTQQGQQGQQGVQGQGQQGQRPQTQGQGVGRGAGASVTLTTDQRTRIRQTVLVRSNVPRVSNINFSVNVGTVVPRSVKVVTVPREIVEIHPAWRGFLYFVFEEEIIIVEPRSHKIVAVLDV